MSIYSRALAVMVIMFSFVLATISGCATAGEKSQKPAEKTLASEPNVLKNYVSLDLAYPYYKLLLDKLEGRLKKPLKNRGEAHITLITPPEYQVLALKMKPERIHELANEFIEKNPPITNVCLGHFQKNIAGAANHTYYVVIHSPELFSFRKQIAAASGLSKAEFDPELFYPHVTLGFTERDFHYEDGARKNAESCPDNLKAIMRER